MTVPQFCSILHNSLYHFIKLQVCTVKMLTVLY